MIMMTVTSRALLAVSSEDLRSLGIFFVSLVGCKLALALMSSVMDGRSFRDGLPPGPRGWPLLGYAPYLGRYPHKIMTVLAQSYGEVYSLAIGPRRVVVVNGLIAVREALVRHGQQTAGRTPPARAVTVDTSLGYFWSSGELWRAQRKFGRGVLRHLGGTDRGGLERVIRSEAAVLCAQIAHGASGDACPVDVGALVNHAVANVMCSVVFGSRFGHGEAELDRMMELSFEVQQGGFSAVENFLPRCIHRLPFLFRRAKEKKRAIRDFIRDLLYRAERASTGAGLRRPAARCMADLYFNEMDRQKRGEGRAGIQFSEGHVVSAAWDMFIAGVETTAVTLQWAVLYLTLHPDVQTRIQTEIDSVVGKSRQPSWTDRKEMPYTRAAIMETQRCANIVPIALPHTATEDFMLRGHTIPKGTMLLINLWSVMTDPDQWDRPEEFRPERFLDGDCGVVTPEAFMPFSAGPRVCMGEQLATMELFVFITSVLQRFNLSLPQDQPRPSLDPLPGITCGPRPYRVCVSERDRNLEPIGTSPRNNQVSLA